MTVPHLTSLISLPSSSSPSSPPILPSTVPQKSDGWLGQDGHLPRGALQAKERGVGARGDGAIDFCVAVLKASGPGEMKAFPRPVMTGLEQALGKSYSN